jgi:uridine kinase
MRETVMPCFIGIAGPSGSGKTELAMRVAAKLPGAEVFSLDSYYRSLDHVPKEERDRTDFDDPAMLDWPLINRHLAELAEGRSIERPVYAFATHSRLTITEPLDPAPFIVVEGLFALHDPEVREKLQARIYVHTPDEICFERRCRRDVVERGRTEESVREQYACTVRPGAMKFVWPTEKFADLVVSGTQDIEVSVGQVLGMVGVGTQEAPSIVYSDAMQ